jgi:hypothetical protein
MFRLFGSGGVMSCRMACVVLVIPKPVPAVPIVSGSTASLRSKRFRVKHRRDMIVVGIFFPFD